MKLSSGQLKQIIKEELSNVLNENFSQEELTQVAQMFLSSAASYQHALLLGESVKIFYNVEFYDYTIHPNDTTVPKGKHLNDVISGRDLSDLHSSGTPFQAASRSYRVLYKWTMNASQDFFNAAVEELNEDMSILDSTGSIKFTHNPKRGGYEWFFTFEQSRVFGRLTAPLIIVEIKIPPSESGFESRGGRLKGTT